jgi:hypothetical protein
LTINGDDRTELVRKLTGQVNAVMEVVAELAPRVPVHGAFCFWLPINRKLDFVTVADSGLPMFSIWTINGYPLWHRRQMVRQLNTAGTIAPKHAEDLAVRLAERFAAALRSAETVAHPKSIPPPCTHTTTRAAAPASTAAGSITGRSTSVDRERYDIEQRQSRWWRTGMGQPGGVQGPQAG